MDSPQLKQSPLPSDGPAFLFPPTITDSSTSPEQCRWSTRRWREAAHEARHSTLLDTTVGGGKKMGGAPRCLPRHLLAKGVDWPGTGVECDSLLSKDRSLGMETDHGRSTVSRGRGAAKGDKSRRRRKIGLLVKICTLWPPTGCWILRSDPLAVILGFHRRSGKSA